jgi:hypothetical protein
VLWNIISHLFLFFPLTPGSPTISCLP